MQTISSEILINSHLVTHEETGDRYEFILNDQLNVLECVRLHRLSKGNIQPIRNSRTILKGLLFEINHVRVNPLLDNTQIIDFFINTLDQIGVKVSHQPRQDSMAVCFKPLGEISDNVRFYLSEEGKLVFLSPSTTRPRLVYSKPELRLV